MDRKDNLETMKRTRETDRNSAIEALKIFAMLLIVICHVVQTLGKTIPLSSATADSQKLMLSVLQYSGITGNTIFFISSCWFLIGSKRTNKRKLTFLLTEIWVVSVVILLGMLFLYHRPVEMSLILKSLLPTICSNNWYMTCYILIYALHPYLNRIIDGLCKAELLRCTIVLAILYLGLNFVRPCLYASQPTIWIAIYFLVAYIKLYLKEVSAKRWVNIALVLIGFGGNFGLVCLTNYLGLRIAIFQNALFDWATSCNPLIIMGSIGLLNLVRQISFKNTFVNYVAGISMLVYIVHENILLRTYVRPAVVEYITGTFGDRNLMLWMLALALAIYFVTLFVCVLYKKTLQRGVLWLSERVYCIVSKGYAAVERVLVSLH